MKSIGLSVKPPRRSCTDPLCPFHGHLRLRGRLFEGRAVSIKAERLAVVEREYLRYIKKFMRYEKRRNKIHAHLPPCIEAEEGDVVKIAECRPLSKTVSFVVIERRGE